MKPVEAVRSALMYPIERFLPKKPTLAERQCKLAELLQKYPVSNETIWWLITVRRGFLTEEERDRIVRNFRIYRELDPDANTSVADILKGADLNRFRSDKFFSGVCFNYDSAFGAEERFAIAMKDLQQGKRSCVSASDTQLWTVARWVNYEFDRMQSFTRTIVRGVRFDRKTNSEETVYYSPQTDITALDLSIRELSAKTFPLLDITEIIKPPSLAYLPYPQRPARVAKLFGDVQL